ncbi:MAG: sulfatase-like hydrolase/transferase, partial [Verrucomicrobiales bacterium]|nr:sulfatase-like hydrolase/transferase [Verrucomicrobiales bacterium]
QYPQRWRITSYLNNRKSNEDRGVAQWLDPEAPMLARFLQQAGYATGHFGKWHMGGQRDVDDAPPITAYGFDESLTNFEGMGAKLLPLTLQPGETEPGRIWADAERLGEPVTWMLRSKITSGFRDAALLFIDRAVAAKKPFYINLWPDDVHSPYWPPVDAWRDGSKHGLYLSVLEEMDRQLGSLLDRIRGDDALRDNTVVLICSDNGPDKEGGTAGPFRGLKAQLYEGGIRSPLVVWAPGLMEKDKVGTVNQKSLMAAIDLSPSILDLAGLSLPEGVELDGVDMAEVLMGKSDRSRGRPLFFRRPPDRDNCYGETGLPDLAMRQGKWKLLCEYDGSEPQLYDLNASPGEAQNLAVLNPARVKAMTQAVVDWHQSMPPDNGATYVEPKGRPKGKGKK